MTDAIKVFTGEHAFLSNFYPALVVMEGVAYPSVEHAYQAAKHPPGQPREFFLHCTPGKAKNANKGFVPPGWNMNKLAIMTALVESKFEDNGYLKMKLLQTDDAILTEGNWWGDTYWGVCGGEGKNHLGKILMETRERIYRSISMSAMFS